MNNPRQLEVFAEREASESSPDWPWYRAAATTRRTTERGGHLRRMDPAIDVIRSLVSWHGYDSTTGKVTVESSDFGSEVIVVVGYRIAPAIHERMEDATRLEQEVAQLEQDRAALLAGVRRLALVAPVLVVLLVLVGVALGLHAHPRLVP